MKLSRIKSINGEITVPGDKSISHRSVMFGSISKGITEINGFLSGADCLSTISCFRKLGIGIEVSGSKVIVHGKGIHGLNAPSEFLDTGNSGTTTRLISGLLSGQSFSCTLDGDASIRKRPMKRIIEPLRLMGADIKGTISEMYTPLAINGTSLHGIDYNSPVASAQVKSCILLAGLYADGITSVTEPFLSRNHTELMLKSFGADITSAGNTASIRKVNELYGQDIEIPGDISSAAYFIAAALIVPGSELLIKNVGINKTRAGILDVCINMGGNITLLNKRTAGGEPVADILVKYSTLHGTTISGSIIPTLIDELPVIAVMAAYADGITTIKDAAELKVKESNRIETVVEGLLSLGVDAIGTEDGMIITGGKSIHGGIIDSYMDHRIAMSFAVAALNASSPVEIKNAECVNISYPAFYSDLLSLSC